jgi:hypothetical protein
MENRVTGRWAFGLPPRMGAPASGWAAATAGVGKLDEVVLIFQFLGGVLFALQQGGFFRIAGKDFHRLQQPGVVGGEVL